MQESPGMLIFFESWYAWQRLLLPAITPSAGGFALDKSGRLDLNQRPPAPAAGSTPTNYYILPDSRGKPGIAAGVSRHQCRTLPEETHPQTHPLACRPTASIRSRSQAIFDVRRSVSLLVRFDDQHSPITGLTNHPGLRLTHPPGCTSSLLLARCWRIVVGQCSGPTLKADVLVLPTALSRRAPGF